MDFHLKRFGAERKEEVQVAPPSSISPVKQSLLPKKTDGAEKDVSEKPEEMGAGSGAGGCGAPRDIDHPIKSTEDQPPRDTSYDYDQFKQDNSHK